MTALARAVTAALIIIGNEILSGRTQDANLPYLAKRLNELGVRLSEVRVVPDVTERIVETVNACRSRFDYVFTTGGIGPTHDDITAAALAEAFGVPLTRDPEAVRRLKEHYGEGELNEARLRMALVPEGAELVDNPVSKAPGFVIGNVFVFAGVPRIMQAMFENIKYRLVGGAVVKSRAIAAFLLEGEIAAGLEQLQHRYPDLEIGSYPFLRAGRLGTSIVVRGTDETRIDDAAEELIGLMRHLGGAPAEDSGTPR
jgi:molybdenum cofactor synthesis domain-containing protein